IGARRWRVRRRGLSILIRIGFELFQAVAAAEHKRFPGMRMPQLGVRGNLHAAYRIGARRWRVRRRGLGVLIRVGFELFQAVAAAEHKRFPGMRMPQLGVRGNLHAAYWVPGRFTGGRVHMLFTHDGREISTRWVYRSM
ncbi:MAG: hypothetical protein OEQ18_14230, partial [Gammaproteobacteria bacterium]|nr:hypothetical protein [Gammaproteobacteria bacterium]